mgnify:FL=1
MANAKISDNSIFVPKTNITDVVGLAGYDNSGNVKISGTQLKASVLSGAIQTIAATSPLERTAGNDTVLSILEASTTQDGYLSSSNFTAFSDADGTVKSVGGTGTVSGITLSGTVTDSGNLTLGGTLTIPSANIISFLGYTPYNNTNPSGFTSNTGTVTNLVFSSPLTGGTIVNSGTVGITAASTNSDGYLTQSDWNTFDSKTSSTGTVTSVGGTGTVSGITLSGTVTTSGNLTLGGTLSLTSSDITSGLGFTPYNNTNPSGFTSNTGTVTSVTTTAPLTGSVSSSGALGITKADTNTNGYLSSTDWNTFNNKTSFAEPGIFSGGGTPTLATNVTGAEIRTLIGAGTGDGDVTADSTTAFTNKTGSNSQWTNDENYTNNVGTVTADNTITFTNKSGNISQWDNDAGYVTSAGDNTFVTSASLSGSTLTLTRNDSVTVDATGFLQVGSSATDALAGDTTTITTAQASAISANTLKTSNVQSNWNSTSGLSQILNKPTIPGDAPVDSVNNKTGVVILDTDDIDEGSNNLYYTEGRVSANTNVAANTLKTSFPGFGVTSTTALRGDTTIPTNNTQLTNGQNFITASSLPTVNDGTLTITVNGTATTFTANQSGNSSVSITTSSDNFYVTGASYSGGTLTLSRNGSLGDVTATGFLEIGTTSSDALAGNTVTITGAQASAISANTSKVSDTGVPALLSSGGSVELNTDITESDVRVAIGAGTSNLAIGTTSSTALAGNTTIPTNNTQLTNGQGFISSLSGAVLTTTTQTVAGAKTFSSDLKVSTGSIAVGNVTNSTTDGRIDAANDVVAFSTSDIRLKDNIKTIDNALDKVNSIQGIEFDWIEKEDVHGNSGHDIGVIAQEIEKVLPDVVTTRESGYKAVKYEKIVPLLIEAIKELTNEINELKNK